MRIFVIVQFYNDHNSERNQENEYCLLQNLQNSQIYQVHLMIETKTHIPEFTVNYNDKLVVKSTEDRRLTFKMAIEYAETILQSGDLVVIINTDIILDHQSNWNNLQTVFNSNPGKVMMALARHELTIDSNGIKRHWIDPCIETGISQDAWIFQKVSENVCLVPNNVLKRMDYCVGGCPGCDNYTVYLMKMFGGFDVYNMLYDFKIFHYDRCRGHTLGQMIFTEKTDFTVRKLMMEDTNILQKGALCVYTNYADYIDLPVNVKEPLNVVSCECYNKPGMTYPHSHLNNATLDTVKETFLKNVTERIIGVCSDGVTHSERTQMLRHSVQLMIRYNIYINILELKLPSTTDTFKGQTDCLGSVFNFPDGAALFTQWAVFLMSQQKYQEALNKAEIALKFNLTNECHLTDYYNNTRHSLLRELHTTQLTPTVSSVRDNTDTKYYICIPLYNRGNDVYRLLHNLNTLYQKLNTSLLEVIIGDFHSTDISFPDVFSEIHLNNTKTGQKSFNIKVLQIDGNFNIAKSLQICADYCGETNNGSREDINLMFVDADTVFESESVFENLLIERGKTYYCPIVSTEAKPTQWDATFNGKVYVPDCDHLGTGLIAININDYQQSGGFKDSEFMGERGEYWGQHDTYLDYKLKSRGLKPIRPVESNVWLRSHQRNAEASKWFSLQGSTHF